MQTRILFSLSVTEWIQKERILAIAYKSSNYPKKGSCICTDIQQKTTARLDLRMRVAV